MLPAIDTALSGLSACTKKIEITAHNVANINTDGFKKSRTDFIEVAVGGVQTTVQKDTSPGAEVLKDSPQGPTQVELSNVDLGEEALNLILGRRGFEANLKAVHTADNVVGSLLDVRK